VNAVKTPGKVRLTAAIALFVLIFSFWTPSVRADANQDITGANELVAKATEAAKQGQLDQAKAGYEQFRQRWLDIEDGVKAQSKTAYRSIEDEMGNVQFALLQNPPDPAKVAAALTALHEANARFVTGGYPSDGTSVKTEAATGTTGVADLLKLLDAAKARAEAKDAPGAAQAMAQFRAAWLDVEGVVLTQSAKVYGDAERDMVDAQALLQANPPDLTRALGVINQMREYLAPIAGKTSYGVFDAATILLREGLEALLVVVALLGFLKRAGQSDKSIWIWGGVGSGLLVSAALAVAVKLLFGTGAFGTNNFLIQGWTGLFAAVMLLWVSYWLHSKSSVSEWNRYINDKSSAALATGNLVSLAALAFLAVFREGTETVLFYVGMASSIAVKDLLIGLGLGLLILGLIAVAILKVGLRIPLRPFFLVSSILVFYLGFKFTGMGIHGLQLAGLLPATVVGYLPHIDALALYPNWQSTLPQLLLVLAAIGAVAVSYRRDRKAA
jgi:high-affinity iron transporter